jgi:hypothetical protein
MIRKRSECRYFDSLEPQSFQTLDIIVLFLGHEIFVYLYVKNLSWFLWPDTI